MKTLTSLATLLLACLLCNFSHVNEAASDNYDLSMQCEDDEPVSYGEPVDGQFFSTENVLEEYEYDGEYCIIYDDPDAGFKNAEIVVDRATYEIALWAWAENDHFTGSLVHIGNNVWKFQFPTE